MANGIGTEIPMWALGGGGAGLTIIVLRQTFGFIRDVMGRSQGMNGIDRQLLQEISKTQAVQTEILRAMQIDNSKRHHNLQEGQKAISNSLGRAMGTWDGR